MNWNLSETAERGRWTLTGSLEIYNVATLRERLQELAQMSSFERLDLSGVNSCDTASLQVLIASKKSLQDSGCAQPFENISAALKAFCVDLGVNETVFSIE